MEAVPLAAGLLSGADWFNEALLAELAASGWPRLSRNQAQVFPLLTEHGVSQAEIARALGITRQSAHNLVRELVDLAILEQRPDDADRRLSLVVLTERGTRLAHDAGRLLASFEEELAVRIGADAVTALRRALATDWGPPPAGHDPAAESVRRHTSAERAT